MARPEETIDRLAGGWRIVQLRRGHRWSTDDLLCAWAGARASPGARRPLDLGCGVGSVGLLALLRLGPDAHLVSVEAQAISAALARKTIALNRLEGRVEVRCADLRGPAALAPVERFDLICANPPYVPPGRGTPSPVPQRAAARLELRGDVFDYCRAAAAHLAPGGVLALCFAAADPRPARAVAAAGLALTGRRAVHFRAGHPPKLALYTATARGARRDPPPLCVRDGAGRWSEAFLAIRAEIGLAND